MKDGRLDMRKKSSAPYHLKCSGGLMIRVNLTGPPHAEKTLQPTFRDSLTAALEKSGTLAHAQGLPHRSRKSDTQEEKPGAQS
jgi:hypothetical protein